MATVAIGRIESIEGSVEVVHADGSIGTLAQGATVFADDAITTDGDSHLNIRFIDGSGMNIDPESSISLNKDTVNPELTPEDDGSSQVVLDASGRAITPDSGHDTSGIGEKIGAVEEIEGIVEAVEEDGTIRVLKQGDPLYANDVIRVGDDGKVNIILADGSFLPLGPGTTARPADSLPSSPSPTASLDPDIVREAILRGEDPTATAPDPTVIEPSQEGPGFTVTPPSPRQVTPDSGHNTKGFEQPFSIPENRLLDPIEDEPDSQPTVRVTYDPVIMGEDGVVKERGLRADGPGRPGEPAGTGENADGNDIDNDDPSEITVGGFDIDTGTDALAKLEVKDKDGNWIDVTAGTAGTPVEVQGENGLLSVWQVGGEYFWSYELQNDLSHPNAGQTGADDSLHGDDFAIRATDDDGDVSPEAVLDIEVYDDGPLIEDSDSSQRFVIGTAHEDGLDSTIDESPAGVSGDDLSDGINEGGLSDETSSAVAGSLASLVTFDPGADHPAVLDFGLLTDVSDLPELLSKGDEVNYNVVDDTLTASAGGRTVFTLKVNADGSWVFDLDDQLDHVNANGDDGDDLLLVGGGSVDSIDFSAIVAATVTDADDDTASLAGLAAGGFRIVIKNDVPDLSPTNSGNRVIGTVHEDGLDSMIDEPPAGLPGNDLSDGINEGGLSDETSAAAAGSLADLVTVTDGADEDADLTFGLIAANLSDLPELFSKGEAVSYGVAGNVLTATAGARVVFTLTVNADGTWTFDLDDQLDHVPTGDDGMTLIDGAGTTTAIDFSTVIEATLTDFDGDTDVLPGLDLGDFTIIVKNDVPAASADMDKVLVSAATDGNVITGVDANDPDGTPDLTEADAAGADETTMVTGVEAGDTGGPAVGMVGAAIATTLGTLTLNADGGYSYTADSNVLGTDVFTYTITDADGDTTSTTLSIDVGGLIVGSNNDDEPGQPEDHTVPNEAGDPDEEIQGGAGDDILVGDPGGAVGIDANFILILDSSGSMDDFDIPFDGGMITRQEAQQNAVNALLDNLAASGAENIRVHLIEFDENANSLGTFNIIVNGVVNNAQLTAAHNAVNGVDAGGVTNYEAGLQQAIHYITPGTAGDDNVSDVPLANADVNQLIFISDGLPNTVLTGDSTDASDFDFPVSAADALAHITGSGAGDSVSEVDTIENAGFTIEAIGINVNAAAELILDQVEGAGGDSDNITTAEQLEDVLNSLAQDSVPVGEDVIIGGAGDDILFGDVLNSDQLPSATFGAAGTHDSQGYSALIAHLEDDGGLAPAGPDLGAGLVTNADVITFIKANLEDLAAGGRGEADIIDGGDGDDIIIGQGGSDNLTGGDGADIFVYSPGDGGATLALADVITDFDDGTDMIDLIDGLVLGALEGQAGFVAADTLGLGGSMDDSALIIRGVGGVGFAEVLANINNVLSTDLDASDVV